MTYDTSRDHISSYHAADKAVLTTENGKLVMVERGAPIITDQEGTQLIGVQGGKRGGIVRKENRAKFLACVQEYDDRQEYERAMATLRFWDRWAYVLVPLALLTAIGFWCAVGWVVLRWLGWL